MVTTKTGLGATVAAANNRETIKELNAKIDFLSKQVDLAQQDVIRARTTLDWLSILCAISAVLAIADIVLGAFL